MNNDFLPRLGMFFFLVGFGLLILFTGSVFARESHLLYLLLGIAALSLGLFFRSKAPRPEPARFSGIRKVRQRSRQRRADRMNKKQRNKPVGNSGIFGAGRRENERNRQHREDKTNENQEE
jgi:cytochrome c biogenesis protein CcdA